MSTQDAYGRTQIGRQESRYIQRYRYLIEEKKKLEEERARPLATDNLDDMYYSALKMQMNSERWLTIDKDIEDAKEQIEAMQGGDYAAKQAMEYVKKRIMYPGATQ